MATEGLVKADCAQLQREAFGILVGSLSQDDALALQAALQARNVPTEVVDEFALPVLTEPKRGHALNLVDTGIVFTDLYGCETFLSERTDRVHRRAAACCTSRTFRFRSWTQFSYRAGAELRQ